MRNEINKEIDMSVKIEISSTEVDTFSGVSKRTGKDFTMHSQVGWMHKQGQPYPEKVKLSLDNPQASHAVGLYELSPTSFVVGKFGDIDIRPKLVRLADKKAA